MRDGLRNMVAMTAGLLVLLASILPSPGVAADDSVFEQRVFTDETGDHKYAVYLPRDYSPAKKWPVILFLHGAGERGNDGIYQTTVGIGPTLRKRAGTFPFVVVMPQSEDRRTRFLAGWLADSEDGKRALKILEAVEREFAIDSTRRVLTGWSMGGYGAWSIAAAMPDHWSAVVPLAGGGETAWASKLKSVPLWAFHGSEDAAIRPESSRQMIAALREAGAKPRYTEVTGGKHEITDIVYDSDAVIEWMLDPAKAPPSTLALEVKPALRIGTSAADQGPFVPAVEVSGAATVRLGNRMLDALAMAVPEHLPKDLLQGSIGNIRDSTVVEGRQFAITFGNISYGAKLHRVRVKGTEAGRVNVRIGIEDVVLRIGGTSVVGREHSATTGPINVVVGHRRPAWISFDVSPYVEKRKLRLKLVSSGFNIENDNWYVTQPAGIRTRGFGITKKKVAEGLVSGLYGNRRRIEREVTGMVPEFVKEVEAKLALEEADELIGSFWPLPVYKPRVRIWPEDVSVDAKGISVVLGTAAAAIDSRVAPKQPVRETAATIAARDVSTSEDLQVAVAPGILQQFTRLLIDADVARIHVLDIPGNAFAEFADSTKMSAAIPELKRFDDGAELWSELVLAKPIQIGAGQGDAMQFRAPNLQINVSARRPGEKDWTNIVGIEADMSQSTRPTMLALNRETRQLQLAWVDDVSVQLEATFAPGYEVENDSIDKAALESMFKNAWRRWTSLGPASSSQIPDVDFGISRLRLSDAQWNAPWLGVTFSPPGVKLTNSSDNPLVYETKGPYSGWGGPYTLKPGKTHNYRISYPLTWRRRVDGRYVTYTLDAGSHSEFRSPKSGGPPRLFRAREDLDSETPKPEPRASDKEGDDSNSPESTGSKQPAQTASAE